MGIQELRPQIARIGPWDYVNFLDDGIGQLAMIEFLGSVGWCNTSCLLVRERGHVEEHIIKGIWKFARTAFSNDYGEQF